MLDPKLYQHRPPDSKNQFLCYQGHHVHSPKIGGHPPPHHSTLQRHPAMAPRPLPQSWSSPSPPTIAHCNGTLQWHPAMAPRPLRQSWPSPSPPPTIAHYNGTLQWHHVRSPKVGRHPPPNHSTLQWRPAMAPRPLRQSWPSPSPPPTIAHYNGTLRWHPAMAPRPLNHSTLQWHPAIAFGNGTMSTPPKLAVTLPSPNHSTLQWHLTMAPYNGTQQWHHVHCTLQWHPGATSNAPKWFVALPPYWK